MRLWKYFPHEGVRVFGGGFIMGKGEIDPKYEVSYDNGVFGITGTEQTTGERVSVGLNLKSGEFAEELVALLNDKKVSVHHAKDVIRDRLFLILER